MAALHSRGAGAGHLLCLPNLPGKRRLFVVPAAALLVISSGPLSLGLHVLRLAPVGLLAVIATSLLLGFGTVAALTRDVWHRHGS